MTTRPPIAVVGVSALFPGSTEGSGFWSDILAGRDLLTDVPATHWLAEDYYDPDPSAPDKTYARRGGFLSHVDFDALSWGVPPSIIPATDTSQLLALIAAERVLRDAAGEQFDTMDRSRISVILGVTSAQELLATMVSRLQRPVWVKALREQGLPESQVQAACDRIADHYQPWQESSFPGLLGNVVAGRIANRLDLGGTNCVTDAACASTFSALSMAVNELYLGDSDLVITGGVDTLNDIFMFMCFSKTPALSQSGDVRPFSDSADGTMLGEGLGMVALKRLDDAERDGDRIYAVLGGVGSSSDGRSKSVYAPVSAGQANALTRAYEQAGFDPRSVELIEAHGTGTKAGDKAEFGGLKIAFGEHDDNQWCALGTVKSQIGHTKAAAGAAGLFKAVMALHHKTLPPTIKVDRPNPALELESSPFYVNTQARPWIRPEGQPRRAGVSSFGFGGSNFHVAVEEYRGAVRPPRMRTLASELVLVGGVDGASVAGSARALAARSTGGAWRRLAWESLQSWAGGEARLAVVATSDADLQSKLIAAADAIAAAPEVGFERPDGSAYGVGALDGEVAFLFPGQGSQYVGMGADLAMAFDAARGPWDRAAATPFDGTRLDSVVMPIPKFTDDDRAADDARLRRTEWAQPGIGVTSLGLLALMRSLGIEAQAVAGHSFGELTALHAAGVWDEATFVAAARRRGEVMAEAAQEPGGMLAVSASIESVESLLPDGVVVANHNHPTQVVVSGTLDAIAVAEAAFGAAGLRCTRLPVATAFHSPAVAGGVKPFAAFLGEQTLGAPTVAAFSGETGDAYPAVAHDQRMLLSRQIARPVRWTGLVQTLAARGVRTFIEVGPGAVLTGLTGRILEGQPHRAVSLDRKGKDGVTALLRGVAQLAAAGVPMQPLALWDGYGEPADPAAARAPKLAIPICGANHEKAYPPAGGAAELPAPNPEAAPVSASPSASSSSSSSSSAISSASTTANAPHTFPTSSTPTPEDPMPDNSDWIAAWEEAQRQNAQAHAAFQQAMATSHTAFLQTVESSFTTLANMAGGHAPAPRALPAAPVIAAPVIAPAAPVVAPVAPAPNASQRPQLSELPPAQAQPAAPIATQRPQLSELPPAQTQPAAPIASQRPQLSELPLAQTQPAAPAVDLHAIMLDVVAEKTGYPADMLDVSMDLEGDLGIDSIKRVEILAAVQDRAPGLPEVDAGHMGGLRTLGEIVEYMQSLLGAPAPAASQPAPSAPAPAAAPAVDLHATMLDVVAEKTGYPADMLDVSMDLEGDLGIDSIKRVEILAAVQDRAPGLPEVDAGHMGGLRTLGEIVDYMQGLMGPAPTAPAAPTIALSRAARAASDLGRFVLTFDAAPAAGLAQAGLLDAERVFITSDGGAIAPALATELSQRGVPAQVVTELPANAGAVVFLGGLRPVDTEDDAIAVAREGFAAARTVAASMTASGGLFVSVQDTGGRFGTTPFDAPRAPLGSLAALVKTASQEWGKASLKAIDVERAGRSDAAIAALLADELLLGGGDLEVGLTAAGRVTPRSVAQDPPLASSPIASKDVVVVSGGARGVTASCVIAWAAATKARFVLLGRSALADEPAVCHGVDGDANLKRVLLQAARAAGDKPTPKQLSAQVRAVLSGREIRATLSAIGAAGGEARYVSASVTDAAALQSAFAQVRADWGPIVGLVHAAGVLADRKIADQTDAQFDFVWNTKIDGLRALLAATANDPLRLLCTFSSVSARCGNNGQAAYAMSNEALNKMAQAAARPGLLVKSLGWGPWKGGMVGPELEKHFADLGVPMIPLDVGAAMFVDEMRSTTDDVELVLGGEPRPEALLVAGVEERVLRLDVAVGAATHPWLAGHTIGETVVVPMVLVAEWFTRLARAFRPDLALDALTDLSVVRGIKLPEFADRATRFALSCRQESNGHGAVLALTLSEPGGAVLYRARARMLPRSERARVAPAVPRLRLDDWGGAAIYGDVLFHRDAFQVIRALDGVSADGISGTLAGVRTAGWDTETWHTDVAALDGGLQLLLLWARSALGGAALPMGLGSLRIEGTPPEGPVTCVARCNPKGKHAATADLVFLDGDGGCIAELRGVELVLRPDTAAHAARA